MIWEDKTEMARLLNNGMYKEAVDFISDKEMDKLTEITENKINEGAELITNGAFDIAPKKIIKTNYGCDLCKFKDICFHTNDDIVELEPLNIDDILERPKKAEERGDE